MAVNWANPRILYVGNYISESVKSARRLPSLNPAGSNRMARIAEAVRAAGGSIITVSSGTSMRMGWTGRLIHRQTLSRHNGGPIIYCAAMGLPVLGMMIAPWVTAATVVRLVRSRKVDAVILYNFNFSQVVIALLCRLILRLPVIQNVEDVSVPRLRDWGNRGRARPLQQLIFYFCMHAVASLSDGLIVPTKRFLQHFGHNKRFLVVTGCIRAVRPGSTESGTRLNVLFSGKLEPEHGSELITSLILAVKQSDCSDSIQFHITGAGTAAKELARVAQSCSGFVSAHGFVDRAKYETLLTQADICVVLQHPDGRYATMKTPSKAYEFLGYGKVVLATSVGDLSDLPEDVLRIIPPNEEAILGELRKLDFNRDEVSMAKARAAHYANENFCPQVVGHRLVRFIHETAGVTKRSA